MQLEDTDQDTTDREPSRPTMATSLLTKPYQANPTSVNSYLYEQTRQKKK